METTTITIHQRNMLTNEIILTTEIPIIYNPEHMFQFTLTRNSNNHYELVPCLTSGMMILSDDSKAETKDDGDNDEDNNQDEIILSDDSKADAEENNQDEKAQSKCEGCRLGLLNQEGHMDGPDGCLYI